MNETDFNKIHEILEKSRQIKEENKIKSEQIEKAVTELKKFDFDNYVYTKAALKDKVQSILEILEK